MTRFYTLIALIALLLFVAGFTAGHVARAEAATAAADVLVVKETYQGKTVRWWARRAVQARKDANARARTIRRLATAQKRASAHLFDWMAAADCVMSKEGTWTTNTGNGYYGAFQADRGFQRAYASDHYARWGTANNWPWYAQLEMAYRGWLFRGWQPWPNTSRACGLR
jgi:hypothetical protein